MDVRSGRFVFGWDRRANLQNAAVSTEAPALSVVAATTPTAAAPARARNPAQGFRDLPSPTGEFPFHLDLTQILGADAVNAIQTADKLVFHAVGDTGQKSHGAAAQDAVAHHMAEQFHGVAATDIPRFFYHLGDVAYFNGERTVYDEQFYEPYKNYPGPIFAIAGNHDGSVPRGDDPLQAFMENFCSLQPQHSEFAGESPRTTMTQPNCYWTLRTPLARIIGLYSNVPGRLDRQTPRQRDWLTGELRDAANERCVIVTVHHPPYSQDSVHGGYEAIGDALDKAIRDSGRVPNLVLCGHVHNYQRFDRDMTPFGAARALPYVIAGGGGFAGFDSLHRVDTAVSLPADVTAAAHVDSLPGFLRLTISSTDIVGEYFAVPRPPHHFDGPAQQRDSFRIVL